MGDFKYYLGAFIASDVGRQIGSCRIRVEPHALIRVPPQSIHSTPNTILDVAHGNACTRSWTCRSIKIKDERKSIIKGVE